MAYRVLFSSGALYRDPRHIFRSLSPYFFVLTRGDLLLKKSGLTIIMIECGLDEKLAYHVELAS